MKRLKVLVSAHELSPYQGSECAVGWNLVTRIARYHDVTVLYARGSQFFPDAYETAIRNYYTENKNEFNIKFIAVPQPDTTLWLAAINKRISRNSSSIGVPFLYFIGYRLWQKSAYRMAKTQEPFDIIHHLTSVTFREPGYLWRLPVPFVWGPTGGTTNIPIRFYPFIGIRAASHEAFRAITNRLTLWFSYKISRAMKKSSLIYAFSAEDQALFQRRMVKRVEVMLETGCGEDDASSNQPATSNQQPATSNHLRVLWCGRLVNSKALDILLKALAGDQDLMNRVKLTIVGDGPLRSKYEKLIKKLFPPTCNPQPATNISFTGWLPRDQVVRCMRQSDVLVHTSYREGTSHVILEALSAGLPVICHDISGISIAVTGECGIKVPLVSYKKSVLGFRDAIRVASCKLQDASCSTQTATGNLQPATNLRSGALNRAKELSWDSLAERISTAYNDLQ
ncbi:MAG: glycosyltransferase family 4 protein [Bacteroidales bacterium]|jgi:glycosyltransferase involved in cell wall biosynthesis